MVKKLLFLLVSLSYFSFSSVAQCRTCKEGRHDPDDSSAYAFSSQSPFTPRVTPNGNSSLGQSYIMQNVCGLNYVIASVETTTRPTWQPGSGFPATINISGIPACFTVQKAFLYYGGSYTEASPPATTASVTNPALVTTSTAATLVGQAGSVCWGERGTFTYRVDITPQITGNGAYKVNSITGLSNAAWEVDGCCIIIIYTTSAAYTGSISLWDGCMSNNTGNPMSITMNGFSACSASSTASAFGLYGDIQNNTNGNVNTDQFNGTSANFTNNFWNLNIINPIANLTNGQATCAFNSYTNNALADCWTWNLAGLYWQNTNCVACAVGTLTVTTTQVNPTCGNNNGSITLNVTGGSPPYTYAWTPNVSTTNAATGLSAGTYSITVTDGACNTKTVVVTLVTTTLTVTANVTTNEKCNGGATGSASATVAGGTAPYTYAWTPTGGTNASATGLTAGTYTVTVHDSSGCVGTATVTITQPPPLTLTTSVVNVKCNGGATGSATATAGGGTPGYTYAWTPTGGTNATATGLSAGTYTITVTDANGCTITATATITQPPALTATTSTIQATCGQADGSASVTAGGGTPAYTYSWAPTGGTNANATGLSAGSYTVTVTDANGCSVTATAIVGNAAAETVTITGVTNVLCFGASTGSITTNTTGGTAPYTYAWTPTGGTNANATGLSAGTYTITVHDANGCVATASATITQPPALTASATVNINVSCNGGANGSVTATAGGGTPGYTYNWTPSGGTNATATGLSAGTYTITVTDANGCTATASVTVTQPPALTLTLGPIVNVSCNGGNNGSIGSTAGGGTPGYTYNWTPSGGNGASATGLSAGTYTLTVTDANGCTITASATVTEPTPLTATTSAVNATCGMSDGSASVTAGGGTPAYTYSWVPSGGNASNATGLSAGTYTVTVTDANGCTITASAVVGNATAETVSITSVTNVSCFNGNNGSIVTNTVGGTAPYTYLWTPTGGTNANATGLSAGTYTVTVHDANGCTSTASATITEPPVLTVTTGPVTNVLCNGGANGTIGSTVNGGTPGYNYNWTPSGGNGATAVGLSAGTYTVTVTDANGCTATASATVTEPPVLTATMGVPANVSCNGGNNGSVTLTAGGGTPNYTYNWSNGQTNATATGLAAGTYTVTVMDANGCTATSTVTITEPTAISLTASSNTAFCNQADGSASVTAAGGTPGYTYQWNNGNTTSAINNVPPGNYNVTVTDANGCTSTATVNVPNTPGETVNITATVNASCNGSSDGSLTATVTGGSAPYTYAWNNGQTNATATGLSAGSYTLTVTDSHGCQATIIGNVGQPSPVSVTAAGAQTICIGQSATISANGSGGTPGYTYTWAPGGGTGSSVTVSPVTTTTYTVTMTDANNCGPVTATVTVTVNPPLNVVMGPPQSVCPGGTATISATAGGGDGVYSYNWSPGGGTGNSITVSPAATTTYTVTVTDNCGTPGVVDSVTVTVNPLPVVDFKADTNAGCSPLCITLTDLSTISSGTITNWAWDFGDGNTSGMQNPNHCYPNPGSYNISLTVTSNNGCTSSKTVNNMITVYSHPVAQFTEGPQPTTIQDPIINFTDQSTDAYGIVQWQWNFGDYTDNTSSLKNPQHEYSDTGTYCANLTVTNKYGCTDSITNCLVIQPAFSLYIPTGFSPNGDGVNDIFTPKGEFVYNFKMYIFDRWGMQLYYTEDINKGWDGTIAGKAGLCQEDTYVYMIICFDNLGNKHSYIGKVSLVN